MKLYAWYYPKPELLADPGYVPGLLSRLERLKATGLYVMASEGPALEDPEPLRALLEALQQSGVEVQLGFLPFSDPPTPTPEMLRRRYAYYEDGQAHYRGLCPAWPENRLLAVHRATQLCDAFAPAALHLDYIRYYFANSRSFGYDLEWDEGSRWSETYLRCHCPLCQTERLELLGREPNDWDRHHPGYVHKRLQQRERHVEEVLRGLRNLCRQRGMKLSAAVRVHYFGRALIEGQDWVQWCQQGLVDLISPMNYATDVAVVERRYRENRRLLQHATVPVAEGLARHSSAGNNTPEQFAAQVRRMADLGAEAVAVFHLDTLNEQDLELLPPLIHR